MGKQGHFLHVETIPISLDLRKPGLEGNSEGLTKPLCNPFSSILDDWSSISSCPTSNSLPPLAAGSPHVHLCLLCTHITNIYQIPALHVLGTFPVPKTQQSIRKLMDLLFLWKIDNN